MKARYKSEPLTLSHVLIVALGIGTVTGWGMWFISDGRAEHVESELRKQISTLAQHQEKLVHERTLAEAAKTDLATLQPQVASLREEVTALLQSRDQAQAELAIARSGLNQIAGRPAQDQADVNETGSTTSLVNEPQEVVIASAQRALTNLGYGLLAADGILGPGTRRAIEEFQYKNNLPVTRELDAATLRRLAGDTAVAAAQ